MLINPSECNIDSTRYFLWQLRARFIAADATVVDEKYHAALVANLDLGRTRGIDATLKKYNLDAILLPTAGRASLFSKTVTGIDFSNISSRIRRHTASNLRIPYHIRSDCIGLSVLLQLSFYMNYT